jgi:hypothetical protein
MEGELLSSYLLRAAQLHASLPHTFCAIHFPGQQVWNRDIDRNPPFEFIEKVAKLSGLSVEVVEGMTFRHLTSLFGERTGVVSWVMPVGVWHRKRLSYGLQFCPLCLQQTPQYFRRIWRLAFLTSCPEHKIRLFNACIHCNSPVAAHRSVAGNIFHCHVCGKEFAWVDDSNLISSQMGKLQTLLLDAFYGNSIFFTNEIASGEDWLRGCRPLLSLVVCRFFDKFGGMFEISSIPEREVALEILEEWIADWPVVFFRKSGDVGVTQRSFVRYRSIPPWLARQVDYLPSGSGRNRKNIFVPLDLTVIRRKGGNWRLRRAEAILSRVLDL